MLYGIDVSEHNGKINWSEIKRAGSANNNFKGYMWQYTDKKGINGKLFNGDVIYECER